MFDNTNNSIDIGQLCGCIDSLAYNGAQFYSTNFAWFANRIIRGLFNGDDTVIPVQPISFNHRSIQLGQHHFPEHADLVVNDITIYTGGVVFVTIDANTITAAKLKAIGNFVDSLERLDDGLGCEVTLDQDTDEWGNKTFEIRAQYEMGQEIN